MSMVRAMVADALASLAASRLRSGLAVLAIAIGVAAVVALTQLGAMARAETERQFLAMGVDLMLLRGPSGIGREPPRLRIDDLERLPEVLPELAEAVPFVLTAAEFTARDETRQVSMVGADPRLFNLLGLRPGQGRSVSVFDGSEPLLVLGRELAEELNGAGIGRIGDRVRLGPLSAQIAGWFSQDAATPLLPLSVGRSVFVSIEAALRLERKAETLALVRVRPGVALASARRAATEALRPTLGGLAPVVTTADQLVVGMDRQLHLFNLLLGAVALISLTAGAAGVMNVMLMAVSERRQEIGLRMAVGARRRDIALQFLVEATVLCLVAAVSGGVLGTLGGVLAGSAIGWPVTLAPWGLAAGGGVSLIVGIAAGSVPSFRASRLDPISVLRHG